MDSERVPGADLVVRLADRVDERLGPLADRLGMDRRALTAVVGVTVVGLLARLVALGARPMHFDEGRVTYWALRWHRTGDWHYRYIVHGPLIQHVDRWLFALFGSGDFVARLPVALVGAALPLAALLFRDRLRDAEVAALAGLLALNPVLLYYSRFMRSDVLVGAFALITLGALVRLGETWRPRYAYAASLSFALAFASKENAVVYVLCWGGMVGLVLGLEALQPRRVASHLALADRLRAWVRRAGAGARRRPFDAIIHSVGPVALFLLVTFYLFAPRAPPGGGVGLWQSPPWVTLSETIHYLELGFEHWIPSSDGDSSPLDHFVDYLGRELLVLGKGAAAVAVLSVVGVIAEFRREVPRVLGPAAFYWGVASLLGYPLGSDILYPPWLVVHAVIPLAIPAAVGLVALGEWTVAEVADGDAAVGVANAAVAVLLVTSMLGAGVHHAYVSPSAGVSGEASMVQFAQPEGDFRGALTATHEATRSTDGLDVLVYDPNTADGNALVDMDEDVVRKPSCMRFHKGLPLSWYLYSMDSEVRCADTPERLSEGLSDDPPVVITRQGSAGEVRERLGPEYVSASYEMRVNTRVVVFFFDTEQVTPPARATKGPSEQG